MTKLPDVAFLTVDDVAAYCRIAKPTAYKLIKKLNDELKEKGKITISGKVDKKYFESRIHDEE